MMNKLNVFAYALCLTAPAVSLGEVIEFSATITDFEPRSSGPAPVLEDWNESVEVGATITGQYSFDTAITLDNDEDDFRRYRVPINDENALDWSMGDYAFSEQGFYNVDALRETGDIYRVQANHNQLEIQGPGRFLSGAFFTIAVSGSDLFPSDELPISPPDLSDADGRRVILIQPISPGNGGYDTITASLDRLVVIPEPASLSLFAAGLLISTTRRHRRSVDR